MTRSATRIFFAVLSAALLTGFFVPAVRAEGPTLSAKFGIAGRYQPGGWCLVTVSVQNPGPDPISGQIQVLSAGDTGRSSFGRLGRADTPAVTFATPVTVSGGRAAPQSFPVYLRGVDPGQADLTVRLVEGRERGDGHVLAEINNQNPADSKAFTGGPIGASDQFLVGFGGDPSAFMFLNGRPTGGVTQPNPYRSNTGMPVTLQVAEAASASDLPDKSAGYAGVDSFLLRSDAPVDGLTEAQIEALKGWVMSGGHLIVCGGSDPTRFSAAFFEGLLPATVSAAGASGSLLLTPKPLPGVSILSKTPAGAPQVVSGPYGAGWVTLTAYDPAADAPQTSNMVSADWQSLLADHRSRASSVLSETAAREENYGGAYFGNPQPLLSEAVMRGPSLDAPGTSVIGAFLLIYLVVLVPVNYLVLKRLDRKEWAWGTIPVLVFLFAAGTFAVGYAAKGGSVFVNRAALIETSAGRREAGVYAELGLFSPHRTSYDIALTGANMTAAIPNPGSNYGSRNSGDTQFTGTAQFVQTPAGVSLPNTSVNMWAMRAFDVQSTTDLGGTIDAALTDQSGRATGTLTNHTSYALTDCAVFYGGSWVEIGTLAPGATLQVPGTGVNVGSQGGLPVLAFNTNSPSIQDRMHRALGDYYRSLGQLGPNYNGGQQPPAYAPTSGEALLAGWSNDPKLAGPATRIDGHSVTENDVSLVLIHIPVSGLLSYSAPVPPTPLPVGGGQTMTHFATIATSSLAFRKALTASALGAGPASKITGRILHIVGIVTTIEHNSGVSPGTFLTFTQGGVPALLLFSTNPNDPAVRGLLSQEVVVTGVLTQSKNAPAYQKEFIVSRPNQLQVVK